MVELEKKSRLDGTVSKFKVYSKEVADELVTTRKHISYPGKLQSDKKENEVEEPEFSKEKLEKMGEEELLALAKEAGVKGVSETWKKETIIEKLVK